MYVYDKKMLLKEFHDHAAVINYKKKTQLKHQELKTKDIIEREKVLTERKRLMMKDEKENELTKEARQVEANKPHPLLNKKTFLNIL